MSDNYFTQMFGDQDEDTQAELAAVILHRFLDRMLPVVAAIGDMPAEVREAGLRVIDEQDTWLGKSIRAMVALHDTVDAAEAAYREELGLSSDEEVEAFLAARNAS